MKYKKYPSYKDSGVEWLGEIPSEWEKIPARAIVSNLMKKNTDNKDDRYLSLMANIGVIRYEDKGDVGNKKPDDLSKCKIVNKGNLIINSMNYSIGSFGMSQYDGICSPVYVVLDINKIVIDSKYALRIFENSGYQKFISSFGNGILAHRAAIGWDEIKGSYMPLPSIHEQQQIANFLDKATAKIDTLIEKQTKQIELLKEKRQAVISHAVTKGLDINNSHWKNYRLDWINTIIRGNTGFKKDELLENGEYVALQYGKTYKVDEVNETFNFYVNNEFYKFNQIVNYGDTILISTSETIEDLGHSCFYNRKDLGLIGGEQILLKPNIKFVHEKYLYYSSKIFSTKLKKYATGLKVFRFSIDDLKELFISIPGLEEQQQIANYLDEKTSKIDTLIEKSNKSIELLKEKRTALISAAVTGKIDVREFE